MQNERSKRTSNVVTKDKEEFEIIEGMENEGKELKMVTIVEEDQPIVELSINFVVGLSNSGTIMKVRGHIQGREVVILVDCGATHNFISEKLVKDLQIATKDTSHFGIQYSY